MSYEEIQQLTSYSAIAIWMDAHTAAEVKQAFVHENKSVSEISSAFTRCKKRQQFGANAQPREHHTERSSTDAQQVKAGEQDLSVSNAPSLPESQRLEERQITTVPTAANTLSVRPSDGPVVGKRSSDGDQTSYEVARKAERKWPRPEWRPPWYNYRVCASHLGWVRSVAVDPENKLFATGSADRTVKLWDLATGSLKLTLTGHMEQVTGIAFSDRYPYMFTVGLDKQVMCWDLEANRVIRHYHGHLSGVYSLALHPRLDLLFTGARDSTVRAWDMRTRSEVHCMSGHTETVRDIATQSVDPQVVSASEDSTIKLWDLTAGKTKSTLTYHKKGVRALAMHPTQRTFVAASSEAIKKYELPDGTFLHDMLEHQNCIINSLALNDDGVLATGGNDGTLWMWDYDSGHNFQQLFCTPQPGSLQEAEPGVFASTFDRSGTRLITGEVDKSVKMWKEVEDATPETHPNREFRPPKSRRRRY